IGLCWAVIDYDDVQSEKEDAFWSLSVQKNMYGDASSLNVFRLMPLDARFKNKMEADWDFRLLDDARNAVAFTDKSEGKITSWHWDFGDGEVSEEQNPIHLYTKKSKYGFVVTLKVSGPEGTSSRTRVWDVIVR
ncbi:MAG: PKD domain-containing protein, partial [Bacteroidales bacterium]|nr:PKD domain-containing protein [Bacteroidales bacterium]